MVIGVGPIGLSVVYWASRAGVGPIAAAARTSQRSKLALEMGASEFLVTNGDLSESVSDVLGGPPDVVFDCVGAPGVLDVATACTAPRGSVILAGQCVPPDTVDHLPGMMKELCLRYSVAYEAAEFEQVAMVLGAGDATPSRMITDRVSFDQFPLAFEALRHRTTQCKVLLDPWQTESAT
jgi:(R,R)-butanediol dehydrogenase/meso-butanediol dehydrogenase/diacetyl reductase